MARRVYIVPAEAIASGPGAGGRTPAYLGRNNAGATSGYRCMDYGLEPVFLCVAEVSAAQHAAIAANAPITVVPADLSGNVGGQRANVEAALESWNIPGTWVTSGMSYREVLRGVATIFQVAQRLHGLYGVRAFPPGITLGTTMAELTQAQRNALAAVNDSFGWDRSQVTGATTLRQWLRGAAQQWQGAVLLGGEAL